jgi:hypothetical protein
MTKTGYKLQDKDMCLKCEKFKQHDNNQQYDIQLDVIVLQVSKYL